MDSVKRVKSTRKLYPGKNSALIRHSVMILKQPVEVMPTLKEELKISMVSGVQAINLHSGVSSASSVEDQSTIKLKQQIKPEFILPRPKRVLTPEMMARIQNRTYTAESKNLLEVLIDDRQPMVVEEMLSRYLWGPITGWDEDEVIGAIMLTQYLLQKCHLGKHAGAFWISIIMHDRPWFVHMMTTVLCVNTRCWYYLSCFLTPDEMQDVFAKV